MKMRPDRAFQDIAFPWLERSPVGWRVGKIKRVADVQLGKMLQPKATSADDEIMDYLRAANISWQGPKLDDVKQMWFSPDEQSKYTLLKGDVLVSEGGDVGRSCYLPQDLANCGFQNAINRLRANQLAEGRFLFYWMYAIKHSGWIDIVCNRSTIGHYTAEKVGETEVIIPPLQEQNAIADYLDRETARMDELVAEKKKMLALLEEKRNALITRAVTRGLDPKAKMKDSGVAWLGSIPAAWEQKRSKALFTVRDDRSENGTEELLTVSHLTGVTPRAEKDVYMFKAVSQEGYKRCYPGDFAVNTLWAWMGAMGVVREPGIVSPDYHVYVTSSCYFPDYFDCLCRSEPFVAEVNRHSKGVWSSRLRLYPEAFFNIRLPVPPLEEQRTIVEALDSELSEARELEQALKKSIALLAERRTALITAAVTGQIDVAEMN